MPALSLPHLTSEREGARLRALRGYEILDTPPEKTFDDLARLAAILCGVPMVTISFLDGEREWLKARVRYYGGEVRRGESLGAWVIERRELLEIGESGRDPLWADHPLVMGGPAITFYAGVPLLTPEGLAIGVLAVMDRVARALSREQKEGLELVAREVMTHLELRRSRLEARRAGEEQGRTEAALRESEERFQSFMQNSPTVAFMKDAEGRFLYVNRWFERVFAVSLEELRGRTAVPYFAASFNEVMRRADMQALEQGTTLETIERVPNLAGEMREWLTLRFPIVDARGRRYLGGMAVDVTEQRQATAAALASAQAKAQFLANMSHEIRTPMNGIMGMADLLLETKLTARQQDFARTIQASAEALTTIINDVLDFSKNEAGKLRLEVLEFDPRSVLDGVVEMLGGRAVKKGIDLIAQAAARVPVRVLGDPGRLRQVLANLVGNAIKFTEGGEVMVAVDFEELQPGRAVLRWRVEDTGIGISAAQREELFKPFHQADGTTTRKYGGTGLGLAICKQIVQQMDGEIGVTSEPGKGSVFWFTVMMDLPEDAVLPAVALPTGERVLLVAPGRLLRQALAEELRGRGVAVETVDSWELAEQRLAAWDGEYVIADGPGEPRAGLEAARQRGVRVIGLRPLGGAGDAEKGGCDAWVEKPFRSEELVAALRNEVAAPECEADEEAAPEQEALQVLVVEDNAVNQQVVKELLARCGHGAQIVSDGQAALEAMAVARFDLVLMDCQMPVLDGYEATRRIRRLEGAARHTWIVAITANSLSGDREKCLQAGMDDFMTKPLRRRELEVALERRARATAAPLEEETLTRLRELAGEDTFRELAGMLLETGRKSLSKARAAWDEGDAAAINLAMHTLKGSAGNFGARRWCELCARLEASSRKGLQPDDLFLLDVIEHEYGLVESALLPAALPPIP